ncbi:hypothetical protein AAA799P11_00200 [Marine Group I thaumarchaeote SCGC AAA799-P11]|uniref:Glycosyltransferase RgtA/B/C/D-like domain-containing protein n=1 Tax=Marine Group I thaumarchaeote SCGC AAA799-P11 TaxID=1502295 RepID=A0A087S325_9ARCH|nr:hypothetical protein AAA799P11_00200 [Marine Group I thaumarchaeote SCGC AAA799-P11]
MAKRRVKKETSTPEKPQTDESAPKHASINISKNWIRWAVLVFSLITVIPVVVSTIFPALFHSTSNFSEFEFYSQIVNPFELGALSSAILAVNLILLGIGFLYYKRKMRLNKLFDFDISQKISWIIVAVIIVSYAGFTVNEISTPETWGDFASIEKRMNESIRDDRWPIEDIISDNPNFSSSEPHVKFSLLFFSLKFLGNIKILPFIASISLLIVTYLLTVKITNKRIAGILSLVLVLQSNIFLMYDTSATYSNFWIVFYLISLWMILKKWQLSHAAFIVSIFSKALSVAFLPLTLFFIFRNTYGKKRVYLLASYGVLIILGLALFSLISSESEDMKYFPENFWKGFAASATHLRFDPIVLLFLLPLVVALFLKSKNGFSQAESISVLIAGVLTIPSLLITFTTQTNEPYRLMPLVVFFAIGAGMLLAKIRKEDELSSK